MIFDSDDNRIKFDNVTELYRAYYYYYNIWENWHHFNMLPHGKGTLDELPWTLDFLKYFNNMQKSIEFYQEKRSRFRNG
jgi:hypothetical protein